MEVRIVRGKTFLEDKRIRFTLFVETLSLSTEDQALVAQYGDPLVQIAVSDLLQYHKDYEPRIACTAEALSEFKLTASIIGRLKAIEEYQDALIDSLGRCLGYLRALGRWDGEKRLSL